MTAQSPERLMYQGQALALCQEPLKDYLAQRKPPLRLPFMGTALRRSYVGHWAFEDDRLMFKKLQLFVYTHPEQTSWTDPRHEAGIDYLFPNQPNGVHAQWYSGDMRCAVGKLLRYTHQGYASVYEEDHIFTVHAGMLIRARVVRNGTAPGGEHEGYVVGANTSF